MQNFDDKVEKDLEVLAKENGINSFKAILAFKDKHMISENNFQTSAHCCWAHEDKLSFNEYINLYIKTFNEYKPFYKNNQ